MSKPCSTDAHSVHYKSHKVESLYNGQQLYKTQKFIFGTLRALITQPFDTQWTKCAVIERDFTFTLRKQLLLLQQRRQNESN